MKWNGGTKDLLKKKGGRRTNTVNNVFFGSEPRNNPKRARINESHLKSISLWSEAAGLSLDDPSATRILPIVGTSSSLKSSSKEPSSAGMLFPTIKPQQFNHSTELNKNNETSTSWYAKPIEKNQTHFSTISDEPKSSSSPQSFHHPFSETESQNSSLQYSLLLAPKKFVTNLEEKKKMMIVDNNHAEIVVEEKKKEERHHSLLSESNNTFLRPTFSPGSAPFFESLSLRSNKKTNQEDQQQPIVFWNEGKQVDFLE